MRMPEKRKRLAARIDHPRLLRVERQPEPGRDLMQPRPRSVGAMGRKQHEVIRIADQTAMQLATLHPATEIPVQQV